MLYVNMSLRHDSGDKKYFKDKDIKKGPYISVGRGGYGVGVDGETPEGDTEEIFEVTIEQEGYCDTCAHDYPECKYTEIIDNPISAPKKGEQGWKTNQWSPKLYGHYTVVHWEVIYREDDSNM